MNSDATQISPQQKLKALRQIRFRLSEEKLPSARACGLTQEELEVLASEELVEVYRTKDEGPDLDRYDISKILPGGWSILSQAYASEPEPVEVSIVPPHKSVSRRLYEATRSGLWDLIKLAVGVLIGWCLNKHFP